MQTRSARSETGLDYDPFSPAVHLDPYPLYRQLRTEAPVYRSDRYGFWAVSRFDDVQAIARDWKGYSSADGVDIDKTGDEYGEGNFLEEDPPLHDVLRKAVQHHFVPKTLREAFEPVVRGCVTELVHEMKQRPSADFGRELAWHLPFVVASRLLGFPASDIDRLRDWEERFVVRVPGWGAVPDFAARGGDQIRRYFADLLRARAEHPQADVLTEIANAEIDGEPIGERALGLTIILFIASIETTASLITNGLYLLARHPDQRRWLVEHLDAVPQAVEEMLRFEAPVQHVTRVAREDLELHGELIREGDTVLAIYGSANRDERRFPEAEAFNIHRTAMRHLGFGEGVHHCLGAPLARLEAQIVLECVLEQMPDYELAGEPTRLPSHIVRGYSALPVWTMV